MISDEQVKNMVFDRFRKTLPGEVLVVTDRVMRNVVLKEMNKITGMAFFNENEVQLIKVLSNLMNEGYLVECNDGLASYELTTKGKSIL